MIEQIPLALQSSDRTFSTKLVPSTDSTFCSAEVLLEIISSLLQSYSDQLELHCSLLEQNRQLRSQFHGFRGILAICDHHNLRLCADNHQLAVANAHLAWSCVRHLLSSSWDFTTQTQSQGTPWATKGSACILGSCSTILRKLCPGLKLSLIWISLQSACSVAWISERAWLQLRRFGGFAAHPANTRCC